MTLPSLEVVGSQQYGITGIFVPRLTTTIRATFRQPIFHIASVRCDLQEEDVVLMADARAEEAARKAEANLKKQREQEIKDAERDAAEMADLMANDPEVRYACALSILEYILSTSGRRAKIDKVLGNV